MEIHNPHYTLPFPVHSMPSKFLDTPDFINYPTSSSRDDPIHSPALQLLAEACDMPQHPPPAKENAPPPIASCSYVLGYSKSPLARLAAMPYKPAPKYHSRCPEVVKLLAESVLSPDEATPLSSDYPPWVIVVAALSLYQHPSYPAHLAFWRPDIMAATADFVDAFLRTREAKYLETLEEWVDAEFTLYTLKGHQRGYYPQLYDPVTGGRTLRKRKAKEMDSEPPQVAEDARPKRRAKRLRKAKGSGSPECTTEANSTPSLDSTPSPPLDMDLEVNVPSTIHESSAMPPPSSCDLLSAPIRAANHRERSSSTASGASGKTLVDSEGVNTEESRENSPADTAVDSEEPSDIKGSEQDHSQAKVLSEKLDGDVPSARSSLSPLESTPPPQPRRSARAAKKTTTLTAKRPSAPARSRSKRAAT